ncbi:GTPase HflX [Polymorphum gilvum]|uniref:GTPase HflX n=1 Tax=Polymorphum gilvum (strain LMG 25793 / CGMCC 1.9160 / SL003B-26A1) TaxID=991905 RepID=F2J0N7_POLGS|nr:GTPase HflX [Polymorphum gilvum]ADZ70723.1 GTP binding protein-like protein [Polymorphum gilvum SL003B-26A1]
MAQGSRKGDPSSAPDDGAPTGDEGGGARALVVEPVLPDRPARTHEPEILVGRSPEARLEEAIGLCAAIDLTIVAALIVKISAPRPATLLGTGKVEDLAAQVEAEEVDVVVVDHALTPIQQRNLERALKTKVIDRTGLILEIFGARARTKEGRLQVDLAHLTWQKSRLVRSWTHLERQRGGVGFMGGPGETQIEADRRQIQDKIMRLEKELDQVRRTRDLHRKKRKKIPQPVVALVGYTNAGKSTLFNRLTEAQVLAKDLLFATLDPTLRRIKLPHGREVILSDTVGFISELPTHLVAAFRATLEEVLEADLILHVRDIAHPDTDAQAADVARTLEDLGVGPTTGAPIVEVWNKIDCLDAERRARLLAGQTDSGPVALSALTGEGIGALLARIEAFMAQGDDTFELALPVEEGELLAGLYQIGEVLAREDGETGIILRVRVSDKQKGPFRERYKAFIDG